MTMETSLTHHTFYERALFTGSEKDFEGDEEIKSRRCAI